MEQTQLDKVSFGCKEHPRYEVISIIVSDNIDSNKRLCCQKCMIYTYRGVTTDQFILLEDLLQGKEQATAYFLPIKKREIDIIQEAIIKSLDNGYLREVEDFFNNLQKKINQKIHDKKKEALIKAEEKQNLIEDLRESFNRSEKVKELQHILQDSFASNEDTYYVSEKINEFLEKHKQNQSQAEIQYLSQTNPTTTTAATNTTSTTEATNPTEGQSTQQTEDQQQIQPPSEEPQNQQQPNQMVNLDMTNLTDLDFYQKFKFFRKKDFQIKVTPLEINIIPVDDLTVQFVKTSNNDLVLGKNPQGQPYILNNGGQTSNCRSDYIMKADKTHLFTFQFSSKPSDYMRIGIAKKSDDAEDKLCQCFGWSNNFDLQIEKGENLSNLMATNSVVKMEVNIAQNVLKFYDHDLKNISKKKSTFNLDTSGEYTIVVYFHSDLKVPITITLISAELLD